MRWLFACLGLIWSWTAPALAAEFTHRLWNGRAVIEMTGRIDSGTAQKFAQALAQAVPAEHGLPILLLSSPGGSIREAFEMSRIMQTYPVHTIIANEARCASACASIVFIAGHYRTVEEFGSFGQHSCSVGGVARQSCNDELAEHAISHGVSHGSVAAFVTYAQPSEMIWLNRADVDGWGISHYPGSERVGWEKSEPRFFEMLGNPQHSGQSLWRLDIFGKGWRAFTRPVRDDVRELQVNVGCLDRAPGSLVVWMEVYGPAEAVQAAVLSADFETDTFRQMDQQPQIWQIDDGVTGLMIGIPNGYVNEFLTQSTAYRLAFNMRPPYEMIEATGDLSQSRSNLIFAANYCHD